MCSQHETCHTRMLNGCQIRSRSAHFVLPWTEIRPHAMQTASTIALYRSLSWTGCPELSLLTKEQCASAESLTPFFDLSGDQSCLHARTRRCTCPAHIQPSAVWIHALPQTVQVLVFSLQGQVQDPSCFTTQASACIKIPSQLRSTCAIEHSWMVVRLQHQTTTSFLIETCFTSLTQSLWFYNNT